jgi:UDP-N-acetylmuramate--alanine ligase
MSAIARVLLARGIRITGSDLKDSPGLQGLRQAGATVFAGHRAQHVGTADAVVVSSAIPRNNPEVRAATRKGIPVMARAQVLAALMRERRGVAVSGTHGKTTTTSMISVVLAKAGRDPTFLVGGDLNEIGSNAQAGRGEIFVAEADESDGTFLLLRPQIAVITNVEPDHLDFYSGEAEIEAAFALFAANAHTVVTCWDDPGVRRSLEGTTTPLLRYGRGEDVDVIVRSVELSSGGSRSVVEIEGSPIGMELSVPGVHNVLNATAALCVASLLDVPIPEAAGALRSFRGVRRRYEQRGMARGATFVDDYAHHPSEVAAVLEAARIDGHHRVVVVFQPHRYSRTEALWREFGNSLRVADLVVLTDVYGAGETPIPGVTGKLLVEAVTEAAPGKRVVYVPHRVDLAAFLASEVREGDLVLTLGAGDITMVAEETLARLGGGGR